MTLLAVDESSTPRLIKTHASRQLYVDGRPFLMRAGEVQNSAFSSAQYMRTKWDELARMNLNTVLGAVTWEMIEPREGCFNFVELDAIVRDARAYNLKLVLLWFGSYKNGSFLPFMPQWRDLTATVGRSTYVPSWVKLESARYTRAKIVRAGTIETADALSPFCQASRQADAAAFKALMRHIKHIDMGYSTVIMVQVENEPGLIGGPRDVSSTANEVFQKPVPAELLEFLSKERDALHPRLKSFLDGTSIGLSPCRNESWESVFGTSTRTDEIFMAYHFACYVNQVAQSGASEFALPMYTNVWLNYDIHGAGSEWPVVAGGGSSPGGYPSGGAVPGVLDIWMHFASSLDFIAPDIYLNDYSLTCATYARSVSPLFIPEQRRDEFGARRIWEAIGSHHAIGAAPFGIDTVKLQDDAFTKHYALIKSVSEVILDAQRQPNGTMYGFYFDELAEQTKPEDGWKKVTLGGFHLLIERAQVFGRPGPGCGMIILREESKLQATFLLIGWGFQVSFTSVNGGTDFTGILNMREKDIDADTGNLKTLRTFGGDETRSGTCAVMPAADPDYGGFPISICIPAQTRIAECTVYSLVQDDNTLEVAKVNGINGQCIELGQ